MLENIPANGRASKEKSTFSLGVGVAINIRSTPKRIWSLLTNAADFPRWNSTVKGIEGKIAAGEKIKLLVPYAPGRTFNLTVSEAVSESRMVWRDGMAPMFTGVRTYTLSPKTDGSTDFWMAEIYSGLMLPMIAKSLPDLTPFFEQYAADLKREAERS